MYRLVRPFLFRLDPETAHRLTLQLVRLAGLLPPLRGLLGAAFAAPSRPVKVLGLHFKNPVGLAAGYDKDGIAVSGLACLGFGHLEIGTVTPLPQAGNPKPRLFRMVADQAVINRMGFPGRGARDVASYLAGKRPAGLVLGVNLGKNKDTPLEAAAGDYVGLMRMFMPLADYLAVNISSPNTFGLRRLQEQAKLAGLLGALAEEQSTHEQAGGRHTPLLVKLAPDLSDEELAQALDVIGQAGMDGVILTNTTLARDGLHSPLGTESGGLSGRPLAARSEQMLQQAVRRLDGALPVISVGGILTPQDAKRRLELGAALVQVYTGLVFSGPGLVKRILEQV